jgi:hypothetical protein
MYHDNRKQRGAAVTVGESETGVEQVGHRLSRKDRD